MSYEDLPPLYHYSSLEGFLGMVNTKEIWLTHINFQNDTEEFYNAIRLIKEVLVDEYPGLPIDMLELDTDKTYEVYTFSMTTSKDLLSQWRGYCPQGGYSFSINRQQIASAIKRHNLVLSKCLYDDEEKKQIIRDLILTLSPRLWVNRKRYPDHLRMLDPNNQAYFKIWVNHVRRNVFNYASIMKHKSFREENEWRITTHHPYDPLNPYPDMILSDTTSLKEGFRSKAGTLIPYMRADLTDDMFDKVYFDDVIISPTQNKPLAIEACRLLLNGHDENVISCSEIPYRY